MFKTVANFLMDRISRVLELVALVLAAIGVKLFGRGGIYAVLPVLLAPMVVRHFLRRGDDRDGAF